MMKPNFQRIFMRTELKSDGKNVKTSLNLWEAIFQRGIFQFCFPNPKKHGECELPNIKSLINDCDSAVMIGKRIENSGTNLQTTVE